MAVSCAWHTEELGKIVTFQRGFDLPTRLRRSGSVPVVSSAGITDFHNTSIVQPPGVITGRYGTIGELFYLSEAFWPLNTTLYVRDFHGNEPRFIYYLLQRFDFKSFSGKSGVPGVNRNDLHRELVTLPINIQEQRAIAAVLSDVDALLDGLDRLIAKKRDIKQAAMQQLLTGQTRLPGFSGEWEVKRLGEIGYFKNGINKGKEDFGHGFPFVNLLDVFGVPSISATANFGLVNSSIVERDIYELRSGDVLFVRSSVKPEGVGLTTLILENLSDTVFSSFLIRFRDKGQFSLEFKEHCFLEAGFRDRLIEKSTVSANTNINQDALKSLQIAFPSDKEEQTAIAAVLSDMDAEITALEARRDKTHALKQGMMQELLTGRIRLV